MYVYSGKCRKCDVGIPAKVFNMWGDQIDAHTGDIAIIWCGNYVGTDIEQWTPCDGLSAIVADQYQTYSDGSVEELPLPIAPYVMGIKDCMLDRDEWRTQIVKKYTDVVEGEHWHDYGFNYSN